MYMFNRLNWWDIWNIVERRINCPLVHCQLETLAGGSAGIRSWTVFRAERRNLSCYFILVLYLLWKSKKRILNKWINIKRCTCLTKLNRLGHWFCRMQFTSLIFRGPEGSLNVLESTYNFAWYLTLTNNMGSSY